jgi:hypothetical protein
MIQINDEIREMTAEEISDLQAVQSDAEGLKEDATRLAETRTEAKAELLAKLGITEEEAQLLLG